MATNYMQAAQAFVATLQGVTQEQQDLLTRFGAYLQGQASAPSKGHSGKRPAEGTITGRVWGICDALAAAHPGKAVTRKEVVDEGHTKQGINWHTVTTQFQAWAAVHQPKQVTPAVPAPTQVPAPAAAPAQAPVLVDPNGNPVASVA